MNIFTKTYLGDFPWIELAVYSVLRHCTEPVNWYVAVERLNRAQLDEVLSRAVGHFKDKRSGDSFQTFDSELVWPESQNIVDGYMRQQWIKMNVHRLVGDHLIWNWDSDVMAKKPFNSSDLERNGKPIWWWDDINHLINGGYPQERRSVMNQVMGGEIGKEYMRCMPIPLLGSALNHGSASDAWKRSFNMCATNQRAFSEFNILGEYCFRNFNDHFSWINAQNEGPTWQGEHNDPTKITYQAWSWGGVNDGIRDLVLK